MTGQQEGPEGFYDGALVREVLRPVEGVEVEDGMRELLWRLREVIAQRPDEMKLLLRGTDLLTRAASAEQRSSPKGSEELAANVQAVLDSLGDQLLPG